MRKLVLVAVLAGYSVFANALDKNVSDNVYVYGSLTQQLAHHPAFGNTLKHNVYGVTVYNSAYVRSKLKHNEHGPVSPQGGQFAPVVLQENIYPLYSGTLYGLKNLEYQLTQAISEPTETGARVIYSYALRQIAPKVKAFLLEQGLDPRNIQMIEQAHPLYPLYVGLGTFGKSRPTCTYSTTDSSFIESIGAVDDLTPCSVENNMIIQSAY
ncbi:hypothetical protein A6A19_03325 [Actinobacillus delphinicola]|uniref:hypothetical protein n=1 Tax=Actinobacillus delphinicola TaxID=51161 RepID=UPI0024434244|nr:hypothetical protein [Actinobacillus delphinicola]MDG6897055.1 hypothetical protein [Actinobacillus delphinicola]